MSIMMSQQPSHPCSLFNHRIISKFNILVVHYAPWIVLYFIHLRILQILFITINPAYFCYNYLVCVCMCADKLYTPMACVWQFSSSTTWVLGTDLSKAWQQATGPDELYLTLSPLPNHMYLCRVYMCVHESLHSFLCAYALIHMCHDLPVEVTGQLPGVISSLPSCESWGPTQTWQQESSPTKPPHQS